MAAGESSRIAAPHFGRDDPRRARDCEQAIERIFFSETVNATTPYVDLDRVYSAVADDAIRAGWSAAELTEAIVRLAARYRLKSRR